MPGRLMRRTAATMAAAALMTIAMVTPAAADGQSCYGVQASAITQFDPSVGGFTGDAIFRFGGETVEGTATAFLTGETSTMHVFETPWGTLTTDDRLILRPIDPDAGLFSLRSRLDVVDGGSGKLHLLPQSTLDMATGTATWEARGHVCFDED